MTKKKREAKQFYPAAQMPEQPDTSTYKVVWMGVHHKITTKVGGFTRGVPRDLTLAQLTQLDMSDGRFRIVE